MTYMTPLSVPVFSKDYVFDPRPQLQLLIAARRYWVGELHPDANDHDIFSKTRQDVRTLVFLHGNGGHKEHWEPTVQRLFEIQQASTGSSVRFRDMWSIDVPNHGDSAILNEETLRWGFQKFPWDAFARGIHAFLAGLGTGVDVDFSKRRLSLVGHSMGGALSILTSTYYPLIKIASINLIEPTLLGQESMDLGPTISDLSVKRQDIWSSTEEALEVLSKQRTFRGWDERILKLVVTRGLRPLPTLEYPDKNEGVTLKCTRKQQTATYRDFRSVSLAYRYLPHVVKEIPTHIVYGEVLDFAPYDWQQDVLHVASGGISNFASVTTAPGVGHMMLQTNPDLVADITWKQLNQRQLDLSHASSHTSVAVSARL